MEIDLIKIKEEYPNCYKKFFEYIKSENKIKSIITFHEFDMFLLNNGVLILFNYDINSCVWRFKVLNKKNTGFYLENNEDKKYFNSMPEVEIQSIYFAFEVLEKKLKGVKHVHVDIKKHYSFDRIGSK